MFISQYLRNCGIRELGDMFNNMITHGEQKCDLHRQGQSHSANVVKS